MSLTDFERRIVWPAFWACLAAGSLLYWWFG